MSEQNKFPEDMPIERLQLNNRNFNLITSEGLKTIFIAAPEESPEMLMYNQRILSAWNNYDLMISVLRTAKNYMLKSGIDFDNADLYNMINEAIKATKTKGQLLNKHKP